MKRILVTGATGFVGRALCAHLQRCGWVVRAALRREQAGSSQPWSEAVIVGDIDGSTNWASALRDVDLVVHLAAQVHVMQPDSKANEAFDRVNAEGTRCLAQSAAAASIKRLVFLSSIKVNGDATWPGKNFTAASPPNPQDSYAQSKAKAEETLKQIGLRTGMEIVILRPPLIYGPGAKGNLATLMQWADTVWPLPLGGIDNQRSVIGLHSLIAAIETALFHPATANRVFLIAEEPALSTSTIIQSLRHGMSRSERLITMPRLLWRLAAAWPRVRPWIQRLTLSLVIEDRGLQNLGWRPNDPIAGLKALAALRKGSKESLGN
ncbi:MAG: NAD-dependent epimerase/dehydratase family protein [Alphaproteobacteria bacterium]